MEVSGLFVLIPSFEPDDRLPELAEQLSRTPLGGILIVDDGSGERYKEIFDRCSALPRVICIGYETNRGKGYALKHGFRYLMDRFPACAGVITADSDGQHICKDIVRMGQALTDTPDQLILGARNCLEEQVPLRSKFGNRLTRWLFRVMTGISVQDTQTGLRAMSRHAMGCFLKTAGDRFEYEMNMLGDCRRFHIKMREIPIETVYTKEHSSHFRTVRDTVRVGAVFLKFLSTSLCATAAEYCIFLLLLWLLKVQAPADRSLKIMLSDGRLTGAFFGARAVSCLINFTMTKKLVFHQKGKTAATLAKYLTLVVVVAVLTWLLMSAFLTLHIPAPLAQPLAALILFFLSYGIQRRFIFN